LRRPRLPQARLDANRAQLLGLPGARRLRLRTVRAARAVFKRP
jgi:hypothetical protein